MTRHELIFPAEAEGTRLDKWAASLELDLTRCAVQGLIAGGHVLVDGKTVPKNCRPKAGAAIDLWGDPDSMIDVLYIKDFCQMVELALLAERETGGTFNVGSGASVTFRELAEHMAREFSPLGHLSEVAVRPGCRDDLDFALDIAKAREELGYDPRYDVRGALEDYKLEMRLNRFSDFFREKLSR